MIELICQFVNYTDEFVWWLRYAYVSPCVSSAFIDRKWIVECFYTCVLRENPRERCQCARVYLCVHLVPMLRSRLCLSCVCACACARVRVCGVRMPAHVCARNRAYVTAWLGAQIQRAQLAHRTSRRIVLILRLHSRGVETATSRLLPRATGRLCFKAERSYTFLGS